MYKYKLLICTFLYLVNTGVHVLTTFGTSCCISKAKTFFKNCNVHFMYICNIHGKMYLIYVIFGIKQFEFIRA